MLPEAKRLIMKLALIAIGLIATTSQAAVCTENLIPIDYVTESPNVSGDDRAALLLPDPVRFAVQVKEPT
jgi:hypothetical protein